MAVACLALFVALAGTATAAKLITGKAIKNNSISSTDIKNRSLLAKDFKRGLIKRGATGATGPAGRNGINGFGVLRYKTAAVDLDPNESDIFFAVCDAGTYPTGGDAYVVDTAGDSVGGVVRGEGFSINTTTNRPSGWFGEVTNNADSGNTLFVDAVCANASSPPAPVAAAKAKSLKR
jgi:hypothetical protein